MTKHTSGTNNPTAAMSEATAKWLAENFEKCDEKLSIPRELFYEKYLEFAQSMSEEPMNAASLGKIVRAAFQPTTRRLGVRGHSKYHYCGLKIRSDSYLYKIPGLEVESTSGSGRKFSLQQNTTTQSVKNSQAKILFPPLKLLLSSQIPSEVEKNAIAAYKLFCQNSLHIIFNEDITLLECFIGEFWKQVSVYWTPIFRPVASSSWLLKIDLMYYNAILKVYSSILMTGKCTTKVYSRLICLHDNITQWSQTQLKDQLNPAVMLLKKKITEAFVITLQRYLIISKFTVDLSNVLEDERERNHLLCDLRNVELDDVFLDGYPVLDLKVIFCILNSLESLLVMSHIDINEWGAGLDKAFHECSIIEPECLLHLPEKVSLICTKISKQFTFNHGALGSLQVLTSFLQEYAVLHHANAFKNRNAKGIENQVGIDIARTLDSLFILNLEFITRTPLQQSQENNTCCYLNPDSDFVVYFLGKKGREDEWEKNKYHVLANPQQNTTSYLEAASEKEGHLSQVQENHADQYIENFETVQQIPSFSSPDNMLETPVPEVAEPLLHNEMFSNLLHSESQILQHQISETELEYEMYELGDVGPQQIQHLDNLYRRCHLPYPISSVEEVHFGHCQEGTFQHSNETLYEGVEPSLS